MPLSGVCDDRKSQNHHQIKKFSVEFASLSLLLRRVWLLTITYEDLYEAIDHDAISVIVTLLVLLKFCIGC